MKKITDTYEETRQVYESIGDKYAKDVSNTYPQELKEFVNLLLPDSKVLEVGCAAGRDAKIFADAGMKIIGTDNSDTLLKQARQLVPQGKFLNMDMRNLDFDNEEFDAIWANAVLLHAQRADIPAIMKNFNRMLKIGGKLHIRVKEGKGEGYKTEKLSQGSKRFFTYFTQSEMEQLMIDNGFKVIRSEIMQDEQGRQDTKWISIWGEKLEN
jgi:ubiquinone/menaquinone biosynthesis C-methylase UbiE